MEHYAGLDVSLKEISICVVDHEGKTIARGAIVGAVLATIASVGAQAQDSVTNLRAYARLIVQCARHRRDRHIHPARNLFQKGQFTCIHNDCSNGFRIPENSPNLSNHPGRGDGSGFF